MKNVFLKCSFILYFHMFLCIPIRYTDCIIAQVNKLDEKNLEETMRNPWKADRSLFIKNWIILGSIPINSMAYLDEDYLSGVGGEASVEPKESQSVKISGGDYSWRALSANESIIDLQKFFAGGRVENCLAYACARINRKKEGEVFLSLGSDDGIKVWLNGKLVHRNPVARGVVLDEDKLVVNMKAGENILLLKIQQGSGGWGFAVRVFDEDNRMNICTGNISLSIQDVNPKEGRITLEAKGDIDKELFKQKINLNVYTAGAKSVAKKIFDLDEKVVLDYKNWPDGVYEFQYVYSDLRGSENTGYLTWYKGDILSAAREMVKSVPGKEIKTPEAITHKMLADMVKDRLGGNLQNPDSSKLNSLHSPLMEYAEIKMNKQVHGSGFLRLAYIDEIDNTPQFCRSYLPKDYDKSKKWPLVVYLHGYNQQNPEIYNWWSADKRHDAISDRYNMIYIEPHGRGNTQYLGIGDRDVMKCIEMAKEKFNVDEDRIYLMGSSMGGFGTWNVATRHPELFAAIAPIYGGEDYHVTISEENLKKMSDWEIFLNDKSSSTAQLESLNNMPILVSHGDNDQAVNVNLSRYLVRMLQRWNYDVKYIEMPGMGHNELGLTDQTMTWFLQHKRNPFPQKVRVRAADLKSASAYWVKITQRINPKEFILADAEVLQNNIIRIDTENASEILLTPNEKLVDSSKPVKVFWNGKVTLVEKLKEKKILIRDTAYKPLSLHKTPAIAGPISQFQNTPFMIVKGTLSGDPMMGRLIMQKADAMISDWKYGQKYEPRVKNDVDVTGEDMKNYSLLLLGGPEDNEVTKTMMEKIPFQIGKEEIVIDGKSFKVKDAAVGLIYPNPYNAERYIQIAAGTSGAGFYFYDHRRSELSEFDYFIIDGVMPGLSKGIKNEDVLAASGFFDHNWKINNAFLNLGDEAIRAKSARIFVNDDLSIKILGAAKPTLEQMNSYAGSYQLEAGGPLVNIIVENGILKGSANSPAFELVPLSENEFNIKEANGIGAFIKDEKSGEFIFVFYQSGREIKGVKIK